MPTKLRLTQKRQAHVDRRQPEKLKGSPLNYNVALQDKYAKELVSLVKQMTQQTMRDIKRLYGHADLKEYFATDAMAMDVTPAGQAKMLTNQLTAKFNDLFGRKAPDLAKRMVNNADKASASATHASFKQLSGGLGIKTNILTEELHQVISASVAENVGLIKSIAQKYLGDVQGAVMRSITNGSGLESLQPALEKYEGMTVRRARNIAYDQTRKAYNNINKGRMQKAGVKKFEWLHTGGSQHPREMHIALSGQVFSFDELPVIDDDGTRGIPGQAINCRCRMLPVVDFGGDE